MNTKTDISAAYVGGTGVDKLYLGNEVVWQNTPPGPVPYEQQYFTVEANEAGTFYVRSENFNFSKNGGPWTSGVGNTAMTLSQGDKVRFKHEVNSAYKGMFSGNTMSFQVYGNIESMEYGDNFSGQTGINVPSAFSQYFQSSTGLTSAENLVLSAEYLDISCYNSMFRGCTSLTQAPALPATTLASSCYQNMFSGCTSLTTAPELPATELSPNCYRNMFMGCTSLTTAPALPVTALTSYCYCAMFSGCSNLATAPALPATALASNCYRVMFGNCTSLTTAPVLPATTLESECYFGMFSGCTSINTITCLATSGITTANTNNWTARVAATGTFVKDPSATGWSTGVNGIPVGWTVQDYVDPSTPVLKIAGQSITGILDTSDGSYWWDNLEQYSAYSFTIEVNGVPMTASTWVHTTVITDECGNDTTNTSSGTDSSAFQASEPISSMFYYPTILKLEYYSHEDNTSDDPQYLCENCQGGCWDGENCNECDPCSNWEEEGYASYEDCRCQVVGEGCEEPSEDPCDDWEGAGYSSYEECTCTEHSEGCPEENPCDDWEGNGFGSYEECTCFHYGEGCPEDPCDNFGVMGYESYEECTCAERGENCPEEGGEEESGE